MLEIKLRQRLTTSRNTLADFKCRFLDFVPTRNPAPEPRATEPRATEPRATEPRANTEPRASHAKQQWERSVSPSTFGRPTLSRGAHRVRKGRLSIFTSFLQFLIFDDCWLFFTVFSCFWTVFDRFKCVLKRFKALLKRFKTKKWCGVRFKTLKWRKNMSHHSAIDVSRLWNCVKNWKLLIPKSSLSSSKVPRRCRRSKIRVAHGRPYFDFWVVRAKSLFWGPSYSVNR